MTVSYGSVVWALVLYHSTKYKFRANPLMIITFQEHTLLNLFKINWLRHCPRRRTDVLLCIRWIRGGFCLTSDGSQWTTARHYGCWLRFFLMYWQNGSLMYVHCRLHFIFLFNNQIHKGVCYDREWILISVHVNWRPNSCIGAHL